MGRAFLNGDGVYGNSSYVSNREDKRLTLFGDYDFAENNKSWFARLMGHHTITGLFGDDKRETDTRSWSRYSIKDDAWSHFNTRPLAQRSGLCPP